MSPKCGMISDNELPQVIEKTNAQWWPLPHSINKHESVDKFSPIYYIPVQPNVNIEICIYSTNNPFRIRSIHKSETLLIKLHSLGSFGHGPTSWQKNLVHL